MKPNRMRYFFIKTTVVGFLGIFLSALLMMLLTVTTKKPALEFLLQALEMSLMISAPVFFMAFLVFAIEKAHENRKENKRD